MMIWPFKKNPVPENQLFDVYNAIVAQSRREKFFADWAVPDTVTGRFDMICLHMCVLFRRLRTSSGGDPVFTQGLFDLFFRDMDRSLREIGISDMAVPKRIKKMGEAFYGLLDALMPVLDAGDKKALVAVLNRNIYDNGNEEASGKLAGYLFSLVERLDEQKPEEIQAGRIDLGEV